MRFAWCRKCKREALAVGHYFKREGMRIEIMCHGQVVVRVMPRNAKRFDVESIQDLFKDSVFVFLGRRYGTRSIHDSQLDDARSGGRDCGDMDQ